MVEAGSAQALMGNHEYNAIMFNMLGDEGCLRPHKIKNIKQHMETLLQFHGKQDKYNEMIEWLKTLPMYIETDGFRAMHACWDSSSIERLAGLGSKGILSEEALRASADKTTELYDTVEVICKGLEVPLPEGISFHDKDDTKRYDIRVKWWEDPKDKTYKDMSVVEGIWLKGKPAILKSNVCCLDYSVAKGGYLTAYRWYGEQVLSDSKLIWF